MMSNENRLVLYCNFESKTTVSYGIILKSIKTGKYLMVKRRHSIEFILIFKGNYRLSYLPFYFNKMTAYERFIIETIIRTNNNKLFKLFYYLELEFSEQYYNLTYQKLLSNGDYILKLLAINHFPDNGLEWTWPKGRISFKDGHKEDEWDCAYREFQEETGIELPACCLLQKQGKEYLSFSLITITGERIESRYWLLMVGNELPIIEAGDKKEISKVQWLGLDELVTNNEITVKIMNYLV